MKLSKFLIALITLIPFFCPAYTDADEEIPIRIKKISDQVIVLQTGLTEAGENITAIAAERGIVVIDTSSIPTIAVKLKKRIEEEFGRDDFLFVINTHHHFDHTNGNQVFPEALIVGHDRCENAMRKFIARLDDFIAQRNKWTSSLKGKLKTLKPDSQEAKLNREYITFNKRMVYELKNNFVLTPPQLTFSDERTMNLGNMTIKMLYYGKAHTDNDIIIHVPEIGMLMVGDLFFKTWLPYLPEKKVDVSRWLEVLSLVLDGEGAVKHVIPGHGEIMEADEIRAMRDYIKAIWEGVGAAQKDGLSLAETKTLLSLEEKFKHLEHLTHEYEGKDFHKKNIEIIWNNFPKSSVSKLESLINEKGIDLACTEFQMNIKKNDKYYFNEKEFNVLGYRLINSGKIREAIEVFKLGIEIFPRSWNLYDSLGEAYIYSGDKRSAVKSYKKSLLLNPKNENGKRKLKNIDIELEEIKGETKELFRYKPGEQTGLYGPYLGQTPPGLEPEVFAPGIVSTFRGHEFSCTFSPEGKEFYFNRGPNIWVCHLEEKGWTAPEPVSFNSKYLDHEPHITADGKKMFFGSGRPRPGVTGNPYGIWVMEKKEKGWDEPRYHGPGMYVTTSQNGNLYVTDISGEKDSGVIVRSRFLDGMYNEFEALGGGINSSYNDWHPCIAPDESFIIFDSNRPGGLGEEGDFYICFQNEDGSWGDAIHMKEISTRGSNMTASLSSDGKYLFYYTNHDIYWVDAKIIKEFNPRNKN